MHPTRLTRPEIDRIQDQHLGALTYTALFQSPFYKRKFAAAGIDRGTLWNRFNITQLPFTTKEELVADQTANPPYGSVITEQLARYCRLCQTSGTSGQPLRWLDTADSWKVLLNCWDALFEMVGLREEEVCFFPFSFGPFLGFWTAFEASARRGWRTLPGGGMSSTARLRFLLDHSVTVIFCTPTYALHLAEVAQGQGINLAKSPVRTLIVAGEPGGSIVGTRQRIETAWGARVFDHHGMTEVGPVSIECWRSPGGLHVLERDYLAEVIDPSTGQPVPAGIEGELVLTTLSRYRCPVVRYRTGDLVRVDPNPCPCGRALIRLDGGIRGRVDDMLHVRGNNVHPTALQAILHRIPEVAEFRIEIDDSAAMTELRIAIEPIASADAALIAQQVDRAIHDALLFRAVVQMVPPGTLPRAELKARRIVRKNEGPGAKDSGK